jgi:hypothetical protein
MGHGNDRSDSGCEQVTGICECGNEHSGSIEAVVSWLGENQLVSQEKLRSVE